MPRTLLSWIAKIMPLWMIPSRVQAPRVSAYASAAARDSNFVMIKKGVRGSNHHDNTTK